MKCPHVTKSELVGDEAGWCVVCLRSEVERLTKQVHGWEGRAAEARAALGEEP